MTNYDRVERRRHVSSERLTDDCLDCCCSLRAPPPLHNAISPFITLFAKPNSIHCSFLFVSLRTKTLFRLLHQSYHNLTRSTVGGDKNPWTNKPPRSGLHIKWIFLARYGDDAIFAQFTSWIDNSPPQRCEKWRDEFLVFHSMSLVWVIKTKVESSLVWWTLQTEIKCTKLSCPFVKY